MSLVALLNAKDPNFDFEHRMAHEGMFITEGEKSGSLNFSGIPYWIDPPIGDTAVPAGWGNTLHAQAHADFISLFPSPYGGSAIARLNDISLFPEPDAWWQFSNFQLHYVANQTF
jgi:hypothetical protein